MLLDVTKLDHSKNNVTIRKVKNKSGKQVYIFRNLYGTPYMYQFDSKKEAIKWAKKHDYQVLNLKKEESQ